MQEQRCNLKLFLNSAITDLTRCYRVVDRNGGRKTKRGIAYANRWKKQQPITTHRETSCLSQVQNWSRWIVNTKLQTTKTGQNTKRTRSAACLRTTCSIVKALAGVCPCLQLPYSRPRISSATRNVRPLPWRIRDRQFNLKRWNQEFCIRSRIKTNKWRPLATMQEVTNSLCRVKSSNDTLI